jgi:hypothetical protein
MKTRFLVLGSLVAAGLALTIGGGAASAASGGTGGSGCLAHHPNYIEDTFEVQYTSGCTGHDEPELDPVSTAPGSAKNMTWTVVLPSNASRTVDAVGPTFWFGGTVTDPNSLFGQAFYELQFYPNGITTNCTPNGGFVLKHVPGVYTACDPVWSVVATGKPGIFHEPAAFNAMLQADGSPGAPLVMHAGDTITVHVHVTAAQDGLHLTVTDLTHPGSGTIVLNSRKAGGPMMPAYDTQAIGNALKWGLVYDTTNSFVWEIGHTSPYSSPASQFCIPGETFCDSFDAPAWAGMLPIQIKDVTFGDGSSAQHWAAVSDTGGKAEILGNSFVGPTPCPGYGGPFCIYPWYSSSPNGFHYGVHYPDTTNDYGEADQFAQELKCGGPFGTDSTYCATVLK